MIKKEFIFKDLSLNHLLTISLKKAQKGRSFVIDFAMK